jgi:hypothetical protein
MNEREKSDRPVLPVKLPNNAARAVAEVVEGRGLRNTHQGGVGADHLDAYLNEFTFRFNRRHSRRRGMLFYRLLEQSLAADPITYNSLIANPKPTGRHHTPPSRPGRVAPVPAVYRPWRQTPADTGPPELNG